MREVRRTLVAGAREWEEEVSREAREGGREECKDKSARRVRVRAVGRTVVVEGKRE